MCPSSQKRTKTRSERIDIGLSGGLFFCSVVAYDRWWQWIHGTVHLITPLLLTLLGILIVVIARKRKFVMEGCLGVWFFYSLKVVFLDQEPRGLFIIPVVAVLAGVLEIFMPSIDTEDS